MPPEIYTFIHAATFSCLTNVNFDDDRFKVGVLLLLQCSGGCAIWRLGGWEAGLAGSGLEACPLCAASQLATPMFLLLATATLLASSLFWSEAGIRH